MFQIFSVYGVFGDSLRRPRAPRPTIWKPYNNKLNGNEVNVSDESPLHVIFKIGFCFICFFLDLYALSHNIGSGL